MENDVLRLLDANLNRSREGMRVLEDLARLLLNDQQLTAQLKALRHRLTAPPAAETLLLSHRRAQEDVGAFLDEKGEQQRLTTVDIARANARRVEESLRVLEETAKLPDPDMPFQSQQFKEARFQLYRMEQQLVGKLLRRDSQQRLRGLYVIVDPAATGGWPELEVAQQALEGGARVIQLRDKLRDKGQQLPVAQQLKQLCAQAGAVFIINDHVDLALAVGADGVHLGQKDLPVAAVRDMVPLDFIVGCSTSNAGEAHAAQTEGADYVAVGRLFPTTSKADTRPATLDTLRQIKATVSVPVVAIGGIDESNVDDVVAAGADMVAVIRAVAGADDVRAAARRLVARFEGSKP